MAKNIFLYVFCIFVFISCIAGNKNQIDYQKDIKLFPPSLVDFFPNNLSIPYSITKNVDTTNKCISYVYFSYKNDNLQNLKQEILKKYKNKYKANDSLLITIKRNSLFENEKKKTYYKSIKRNANIYYPIVFFEYNEDVNYIGIDSKSLYSPINESGLSDDFTIYLLDSNPGIYWKGLNGLDYMPDGWKNGYSKGICINEKTKTVIYWVVIW